MICYTLRPARWGSSESRAASGGTEIEAQAAACGLQVIDRLYVTGNAWGAIGGEASEQLPETPAHLAVMLTASNQHAGAALPLVDEALARDVAQASTDLPLALALALAGGDLLPTIERAVSWASTEQPTARRSPQAGPPWPGSPAGPTVPTPLATTS